MNRNRNVTVHNFDRTDLTIDDLAVLFSVVALNHWGQISHH